MGRAKAAREGRRMLVPPPAAGAQAPAFVALFLATLALGIAFGYGNVLDAPFVLDDRDTVLANASVHLETLSWEGLRQAAVSPLYHRRPLANLSFALNYHAGGAGPRGYHVVNLAIHFGAAVAVYLLVARLLSAAPDPRGREKSAVAALLWALHPVQTEAVTYVTQRMTSLAGFFYLWGLAAYVAGRQTSGARRWIALGASGLAFLLALGTKEIALTFPLAVLLLEWLFLARGDSGPRRLRAWGLGALATLAVAVVLLPGAASAAAVALRNLWSSGPLPGRDFSAGERLLTEARVVVWYATLLVFPHPGRLNLDHDVLVSHGLLTPPTTLVALVLIAGALAAALAWRRRFPLLTFAILWFALQLALESTILGLELAFEHRLYLACLGPILLFVDLLYRWLGGRPGLVRIGVASALLAALTLATRARNDAWTSQVHLYADSARKSPGKARPFSNLGTALYQEGRYEEALRAYAESSRIDPRNSGTFTNLGLAHLQVGHYPEALRILRSVVEKVPPTPEALYGLGMAWAAVGNDAEAGKAFRGVLRLEPRHPFREPILRWLRGHGQAEGDAR